MISIYRSDGTLLRELTPEDASFVERTMQGGTRAVIEYIHDSHIAFPQLSFIEWQGERLTMYGTPKVKKESTREYHYTLTFESIEVELQAKLLKFTTSGNKTRFTMTATPRQLAEMVLGNLPTGWSISHTIEAPPKVISFKDESILQGLQRIAREFETEAVIKGRTIGLYKRQSHTTDPLVLKYYEGLERGIEVAPDGDEQAIGRLYVHGEERNIDRAKYGSPTLRLPKGATLTHDDHTFKTDPEGQYIYLQGDTRLHTAERAFDGTGIYPSHVGKVTSVETKGDEYDIIDSQNKIDYSQHRVQGAVMEVTFQSGRLAGRSFPIATKDDKLVGYRHAEGRFMLVRQEYDGVMMPEPTTFYPSIGDEYAIFGCSLPNEYTTEAEQTLFRKGVEYMAERLEPRKLFRANVDGIWAKKKWGEIAHKIELGGSVRLTDTELGATKDVRISGIRVPINDPYSPRLTFTNAPFVVGTFSTRMGSVEAHEVRIEEQEREIARVGRRSYKETEAIREMVEKLGIEGFTHSVRPETLETMYAVIGSSRLQFKFVKGLKDTTTVPFKWSHDHGKRQITIPTQYLAQRETGDVLTSHTKIIVTPIKGITYTLKAEERQAYLYADLTAKSFKVSTSPIKDDPNALIVGLLTDGGEAFTLTELYGFTEISPSHIATGRIQSEDGRTYFDLVRGEIGGNITFRSGSLDDWATETDKAIEDAKNIRQPIIGEGGTWLLWDDDKKEYVDSGVKAKGDKGDKGDTVRPNLINMSKWKKGYLYGDYKRGNPGDEYYGILDHGDFWFDPTYIPVNDHTHITYYIEEVASTSSAIVLVCYDEHKSYLWWCFGQPANRWDSEVGSVRVVKFPTGTRYIRLGVAHSSTKGKAEWGNSATAYIPHPDDLKGADGAKGADAINVSINVQGEFHTRFAVNKDTLAVTPKKIVAGGAKTARGQDVVRLTARITKGGTDVTDIVKAEAGAIKWYYKGTLIPNTTNATTLDLTPDTYADGVADAFEVRVDTATASTW